VTNGANEDTDDDDRLIVWTKSGRETSQQLIHPLDQNKTISFYMAESYEDPPTTANYNHYGADEEICFEQDDVYYRGAQSNSMARIHHDNADFIPVHACSNFAKAANGTAQEKLDNRVTHVHHRYNYMSGAGTPTPSWGSSPTWPDATQGKAYWDFMYYSFDNDGGSPDMNKNCVSYAFDGLDSGQIQVNYWVDSQGYNGSEQMNKLWNALDTTVYPDDEHTFSDCPISDGDVAGNSGHAWVLYDPGYDKAAQTAKWTNAGSGEYVWSHSGNCTNKAPAVARDETNLVAFKLWYLTEVSNPYYTYEKIKRE